MHKYQYRGITWIEAFSPEESELQKLSEEHSIDHYIIHDIFSPTPHLYTNQHGDALYAVFHFPTFRLGNGNRKRLELDFVIKKDLLMTVRYDSIEPLEVLGKKVEANENLSRHSNGDTIPAPVLANIIIREMYLCMLDDLASFADWLQDIEDRVYRGKEKEMVTEISLASRDLTKFRAGIYEHEKQLFIFEEIGERLYGEPFTESFKEVKRRFHYVRSQTQFLTELVIELRETNNSLVSTKQNEITKILTVLAFVTFPLSLIAGIFGMNVTEMPVVGDANGFWIILSSMVAVMLSMFLFFRYKKWL